MKIIMIDQDGVALNEKYELIADVSVISEKIKKDKKVLLIPNSDTPVKRLAKNFKLIFGFKPKIIIAEKGAVVKVGRKKVFPAKISGISEYIRKLVTTFQEEGARAIVGDSATWIREKKRFTPNSRILIVDAFREQTVGFYLKKTNGLGHTFTDNDWSETGMHIVTSVKLPEGLEQFSYNPSYGIAISNARGVSKQNGLNIIRKIYPGAEFYMIGDSDNDYLGESVIHCAVSNASENFKCNSEFVAKKPYTTGMKECIEWILKK